MSCEHFSSNTDIIFLVSFFLINYNLTFKVLFHPLESDCAYVEVFCWYWFWKLAKLLLFVTDVFAAFTFWWFFPLLWWATFTIRYYLFNIFLCVFKSCKLQHLKIKASCRQKNAEVNLNHANWKEENPMRWQGLIWCCFFNWMFIVKVFCVCISVSKSKSVHQLYLSLVLSSARSLIFSQ